MSSDLSDTRNFPEPPSCAWVTPQHLLKLKPPNLPKPPDQPGESWRWNIGTITGSVFFVFFTLWSLGEWLSVKNDGANLPTIAMVILGVSGQICGLLMILIGKVIELRNSPDRSAEHCR
jgi:hypothetical protein